MPVNQPLPEVREQIRIALQEALKERRINPEGTNAQLRQRLRDAEMAETVRELREQGTVLPETEDWVELRQAVMQHYATELAQREKDPEGNLRERKERLRFAIEGTPSLKTQIALAKAKDAKAKIKKVDKKKKKK